MTQEVDRFDEIDTALETLTKEVRATNQKVEKWDGRLWGLTIGLIGSAWVAIIAAAVAVIVRTFAGK